MTPAVGSFVSYKDLYDEPAPTLPEICNNLEKYEFWEMVESIAKLNFHISYVMNRHDAKLQLMILKNLLPEKIYKKAESLHGKTNYMRVYFTRHQFLYLLRLLMSCRFHDGMKIKEDIESYCKILFSVTDHIEREMEKVAGANVSKKTGLAKIIPTFIRNHWLNHEVDYARRLVDIWQIYTRIAPTLRDYDKFLNLFKNTIDLVPIEFVKAGMLIGAHYTSLLMSPDPVKIDKEFRITSAYFSKITDEANKIVRKVVKYLRYPATNEKGIPNPYDVIDIYEHPILEFSDSSIMPLDLDCLNWKITDGIFWQVFDKVDDKEKRFLNTFWGEACHKNIMEYIQEIVTIQNRKNEVILVEETQKIKHRQVDAIIYYKGKLLLFEITIRGFKIKTLRKASRQSFLDELDEILLTPHPNREHSSGKMIQINECLERIREGSYSNLLPREAQDAEAIPVLIMSGTFPISPFMGQMIATSIENRRDIELSQEIIDKTLFLKVEDIDTILWAVENDKLSLDTLLDSYTKQRFDNEFTYFVQSFHKLELGRSSFAEKVFDEFRKEIAQFFFNRQDI